jgi:hypothetical protein
MLMVLQESFSQMSVGGFVLVIGAICAVFAIMRGVLRMITASAMLVASAMVGYWVWIETPGIGQRMMESPPLWAPFVLPAVAGFATFITLQRLLRLILRPFGTSASAPSSMGGKMISLVLSLVPTSLICVAVATAVRHIGTIQEIENPTIPQTATLLKQTIDRYIPPAWMQRLDPLTDPKRITLAKLVSMASDEQIPRAIPVQDAGILQQGVMNDPRLQEMVKEKRFSEILRDPSIQRALDDPRIQKALLDLIGKGY